MSRAGTTLVAAVLASGCMGTLAQGEPTSDPNAEEPSRSAPERSAPAGPSAQREDAGLVAPMPSGIVAPPAAAIDGAAGAAGTATDAAPPSPSTPFVPSSAFPLKWAALGIGPFHLCFIRPNLELDCGKPRDPTLIDRSNPPPGLKVIQIAAGHIHNCVITPPGTPERVQCIRNPLKNFYSWADVPKGLKVDPLQIVAGDTHNCVLDRNGAVTCWGRSDSKSTPPPGLRAKLLAACGAMTCAIRADNRVVCWGLHPAEPPADLEAVRVAVNSDGDNVLQDLQNETRHACAIRGDASVTCWGDNNYGQIQVPAGLRARELALGRSFSCALLMDGQVQCWGRMGSTVRAEPLPAGLKAKAIAAGNHVLCAIKEDDTVTCPNFPTRTGPVFVPN